MIAGNWKMNNDRQTTRKFIDNIEEWLSSSDAGKKAALAAEAQKIEIVIAPTFTSIETAVTARKSELLQISAQNVYFEPKGAFTGEISLSMLEEAKCKYVILGHSERRHILGESDELLEKKLRASLESNVLPIFCVGELLEDREAGRTNDVLKKQLESAWRDIKGDALGTRVVVAYEPVWAIGTGKTASNEDAQSACEYIRKLAKSDFDQKTAESLRILYGGSVKPDNSAGLINQQDIDGFLIGGAALDVDSFEKIIAAAI
jgi:triosephosphate isomerase